MHVRRLCLAATLVAGLGCGTPARHVEVQQKEKPIGREHTPNPLAAGDAAIYRLGQVVKWVQAQNAEAVRKWVEGVAQSQAAAPQAPSGSAASAPTPSTGTDWTCVANVETGSDWSMHGSTYSTAYGIINDIVNEYASPEVQAKVYNGTATQAEQTDIVERFAAAHGTGGWGVRTREMCGL